MFIKTLSLAVALCGLAGALNAAPPLRTASAASIERAAALDIREIGIAAWIWTDKVWYGIGESATLRWTVKTDGETGPYTMVVYRQNNQTGVKTYFPGDSTMPTDLTGNAVGEFKAYDLSDTEKGVLLGEGGLAGGAATMPDEPGMHTFVVEFRTADGNRILKTCYMKVTVITDFVDVTGNIEDDVTWRNTKLYRLNGVTYVRNNATLTIEPGTVIIGQPGSEPPSVLVITPNGRIMAEGTASRPIIMTSALPMGQRSRGDWGGLILLGKAPINVAAGAAGKDNPAGQFYIEGLPAGVNTRYGGSDPEHDCGTLRYVRVEFAGSIFSPNNEANSFTWGGCGTKTTSEFLQASYGLDDSFEWFGGTNNAKYLIGGLGADDFVDFQLGFTGKIQYGIFYQDADSTGNRGIEGDNSEYDQGASPLSKPEMYNLTFIGSGVPGFDESNAPGIYLRRGAGANLYNTLVTRFFSTGVHVDGSSTQAQIDAGRLTMDGILLWNNNIGSGSGTTLASQIHSGTLTFAQGTRGNGRNFLVADPKMRRAFEFNDPDFRPLPDSPIFRANWVQAPDNGFFDQRARFAGGAGDEAWWQEWTFFVTEQAMKK
jgi:hypothetical protein